MVLPAADGPEALRLEDAPDPTPGPDEVVVRVRAAALNHRDLFICRGQYAGLRFPIIIGSDGCGEVAAAGPNVRAPRVGAPVMINPSLHWGTDPQVPGPTWRILGLPDDGTFAEFVKVPAANALPRPAGLTDADAAAIPLCGLTAYRAVVARGGVRAGETVLVIGVGGGVATFALLFAKHAGARVLVTSSSDAKLARARELGADDGFNYTSTDWVKAVRAATGGNGPDLIVDGTGGPVFDHALDAARPGGRVVTYGATLGAARDVAVRRIFWKHLTILGSTMGSPDDFRAMLALFDGGRLRPVVDQTYALAEAGQALLRMDRAAQFGKIILRIA